MDILIRPKKLSGKLTAITSKSFAHRAIICAALSEGVSIIKNVNYCDDVNATINSLREIVEIKKEGRDLIIKGGFSSINKKKFWMENSGSTLRFLLPILSYFNTNESMFMLGKTLEKRPTNEYENIYKNSKKLYKKDKNTITTKGFPDKKSYTVSTEQSSQFVSGILLLSPKLGHDVEIKIPGNINSKKYIEETIYVMSCFGISVKVKNNKYFVSANQKYTPTNFSVPSDLSFITNCMVMNKLGSSIELQDLMVDQNDPDYEFFKRLETDYYSDVDTVDFENNIDLVPPMVVYKSLVSKTATIFTGISRLKYKESNRILSITKTINSAGGKTEIEDDHLLVFPVNDFAHVVVDSFDDHRIAFMGIVLSTVSSEEIIIKDFDCVEKSYPHLLNDFYELGLDFEILKTPIRLKTTTNNKTTNIIIQQNCIKNADTCALFGNNKTFYIIDKNVPIEKTSNLITSPFVYVLEKEREDIKSFSIVNYMLDKLLENDFSKSDYIVAIGGGCTLDMAGFVAMIYKRGIKFISVPTTLLSQVDASVGGKVAINEQSYKNAIGGFYQPETILIDPTILETLPEREHRCGMAEIIKTAALCDPTTFFDIYDKKPYENILVWIIKTITNKIGFVNADPYDENQRKALNFGHTYGHAIESLSKGDLSHGEAVAKGMCYISDNPYLKFCLEKYGFNLDIQYSLEEMQKYIINDKKIKNNKLVVVELEEIGKYRLVEKELQ